MPQVWIDSDEWYPVYSVIDPKYTRGPATGEVDEATLARWKSVFAEFDKVQNELHDFSKAAWRERQV